MAAQHRARVIGAMGFNPLIAAARRALREERIGRLVAIRSAFCAPLAEVPQWKRASATGGGGVLPDLASHHLDFQTNP